MSSLIQSDDDPSSTSNNSHENHIDSEHFHHDSNNTRSSSSNSSMEKQIQEINQQYQSRIQISTNDLGYALYAQKHFAQGELVMKSRALSISKIRDAHSVQTHWNQHATIDLPARFINHSCQANVGILDNSLGAFDFYAIQPIEPGQELLWDYTASEWEIRSFSQCLCKSVRCRQVLKGFKEDGESVRKWYGKYYADYLKEL